MVSFNDMLAAVKREIREVSIDQLHEWMSHNRALCVIDVREPDEFAQGCLTGAVSIPRGFLELRVEKHAQRDREILLYCASGVRSALAARTLQEMGYSSVWSLAGGYNRWKDSSLPIEKPVVLTPAQRERYRRHLIIPEVGEDGQLRLLSAKVLLLGAGGLGSPAALYLAAAGVGTIGIVDDDSVDLSNLQRQILHNEERLGQSKADSAAAAIHSLNSDVKVVAIKERLNAGNARRILESFDIVLDGSDNFSTRYLLNDACVAMGKPNVHGSIFRFEGQVTTFLPGKSACYRCLFPEAPTADLAPSCAEAGVLGVLPGIVGIMQANEVLKLVLGKGDPLANRLLTFNALSSRFSELSFGADPDCTICRPGAKIELTDAPPAACRVMK